jgi:hypothetical protein
MTQDKNEDSETNVKRDSRVERTVIGLSDCDFPEGSIGEPGVKLMGGEIHEHVRPIHPQLLHLQAKGKVHSYKRLCL